MIRVYAIVVVLLIAAIAYQTHRANSAIKALAKANVELEIAQAQVRALDEARVLDTRIADQLSAIREGQKASDRKFSAKLDSIKVTREVPREGDTCTERDAAAYRGLFNEALGTPASADSLF